MPTAQNSQFQSRTPLSVKDLSLFFASSFTYLNYPILVDLNDIDAKYHFKSLKVMKA
jgi:hypothetical protein